MSLLKFVKKLKSDLNIGFLRIFVNLLDLVRKYPWRTIILILMVSISFGLKMHELSVGAQHEFPGSDPYASIQNAKEVLYEGKDINFYLNPLAALYIILIYGIFGEHLWLAKFIQILASFAIPFFLYYFTRKYFGDVAGFIAAMFSLIHPSIVFYSAQSWAEFWILFLFSFILYLFAKIMDEKKHVGRRAFLIGLFTGIASLGKIWMGLIGGMLILFVLIKYYTKEDIKSFFNSAVKIGGLALLGVLIILIPWTIYASSTAGFFVFVNINSQTNLYIGNNPEGEIAYTSRPYNYEYMYVMNIEDGNCGDLLKNVSGQVTSKKNEEYIRKCAGKYASSYIFSNPGKFISKMSKFTFNYWLFPNLEFYQRNIETPKLLKFTLWTFWVLAFVGILVSLLNFKDFIPFYLMMIIIWFISGMAFYLARYKAGLAPITILFAAGGLYTIGHFMFGNQKKK